MKYLVVENGKYHRDPPVPRCPAKSPKFNTHKWKWGNKNLFDPIASIAWGREAMKSNKGYRKPCLHCFPECKP
jgi:hypothetical protein